MTDFTDITARIRDMYDSRFEPEGVRPLADIYWRTLIVTGFVFVAAALTIGFLDLFGAFDTLTSIADTSAAPRTVFDRAALRNLSQGFDARKARFDGFSSNPPAAIADPGK